MHFALPSESTKSAQDDSLQPVLLIGVAMQLATPTHSDDSHPEYVGQKLPPSELAPSELGGTEPLTAAEATWNMRQQA